jgi:CheY-like chemotaxis protein
VNKNTGKRILIVDDDSLLRDFFAKGIASEGYSVTAVGNGDDAIEELEKKSDFALAIIDLLMPVRTGWELIEFMKDHDEYKNIPVILLTGLAASFNEFQKASDRCDAVMHKGNFEISELISTINDIISKKRISP